MARKRKPCLKTWNDLDPSKGLAKAGWCRMCQVKPKVFRKKNIITSLFSPYTGDALIG